MSRGSALTTTSYALLGLLAVKPWSTYELTQQMDRSLGRFWPRATSKLYEEPKKLVAEGLARTTSEQAGGRTRTVYTITAKGRRALAGWLQEPGAGPVLDFEQLLKVFFADHGSTEATRATLAATQAWAEERNEVNRIVGRAYLAGRGAVPGASRADPARRTIPHRLLQDGGGLGRLGEHPGAGMARRPGAGRPRSRSATGVCPPGRVVARC